MTDVFEKHPRPWVADGDDVLDASGNKVVLTPDYFQPDIPITIVAAVNAEPELRARIANLESYADTKHASLVDVADKLRAARWRIIELEACLGGLRHDYVEMWQSEYGYGKSESDMRDALPSVERADALLADVTPKPESTVAHPPMAPADHLLKYGRALCSVNIRVPGEWGVSHLWTSATEPERDTCAACIAAANSSGIPNSSNHPEIPDSSSPNEKGPA